MDASTISVVNTTAGPSMAAELNVAGLVVVLVFYALILAVGLWAGFKSKSATTAKTDSIMLAGRDIGAFIGVFTMTATWVGGGYINGTVEQMYNLGLVNVQAPIGYSISLFLGGLLFAKRMREAGYVTQLDPFAIKYGELVTAILFIPCLLQELFWSASILRALGASLAVILGLGHEISIVISAAIAIFYTVVGGLYSVAFTDVIQLCCIFGGLWLGVGFSLNNPIVEDLSTTYHTNPAWWHDIAKPGQENVTWVGVLPEQTGSYADSYMLLIFGGIPWQVYFQRVLAARTPHIAQMLSYAAALGCMIMAVPAALLGAIARSADWANTTYPGEIPIPPKDASLMLPLVLQYLCPYAVAVIGLGAVSAAVMSSADSSILSAASMFARNMYRPFRNALTRCCCSNARKASETEIIWIMRLAMVIVGVLAMYVAIEVKSIYVLFYLCSDLVFVIVFPQLLAVVYLSWSNTYGSAMGIILGILFRFTGGEPLLNFHPVIEYPGYAPEPNGRAGSQNFPFKTVATVISLAGLVIVSGITHLLFTKNILPPGADIFHVFKERDDTGDDFTPYEKRDEQGRIKVSTLDKDTRI